MKLTRLFALSLSLSTVGCAAVTADTAKTSSPTQTLVLEVPNAPPDPKPEIKPACPGPGHIWVAGYWDYIGGHHIWRDGRWVEGKAGYEYVRARYEWDGKAWQFHIPYWHRRAVGAPMAPQMANAQTGASSDGK
jgi:hypothetical protein